jgi:hypothetical protein
LQSWYWRTKARKFVERQRNKVENTNVAKNIILFLGDGMSMVTQAATRVYLGGEEKELTFEKFPYVAMSKVSEFWYKSIFNIYRQPILISTRHTVLMHKLLILRARPQHILAE